MTEEIVKPYSFSLLPSTVNKVSEVWRSDPRFNSRSQFVQKALEKALELHALGLLELGIKEVNI